MYSLQTKFFFEAVKVTLFSLVIVALFYTFGASQNELITLFAMAVIVSAATFVPEKKKAYHYLFAGVSVCTTIILAGALGYYFPEISKFLVIAYALLAFGVPKIRFYQVMFINCTVMFFVFTALPFDWHQAVAYIPYSLVLIIGLTLWYLLFEKWVYERNEWVKLTPCEHRREMAMVAGVALAIGYVVQYFFQHYTDFTHLYWVGLTIIVVVQSSSNKTIEMSIKRVLINTVGALIVVVLMGYIVPSDFWINFALMTLFLFCIFAFGYSYFFRTLFIEMFVLGITHFLGSFQDQIALDRIVLTLIGGAIVIVVVLLFAWLRKSLPNE